MSDPKLVILDLSALTVSTEVIESSLLAHGIQVVRMEVGGHSVYPSGSMGWIDLYVPEDRMVEAQAILEKIAQMESSPSDELPLASDEDSGISST